MNTTTPKQTRHPPVDTEQERAQRVREDAHAFDCSCTASPCPQCYGSGKTAGYGYPNGGF